MFQESCLVCVADMSLPVMALVELSCLFAFNNNYGCVRLNITVIESDEVGEDKF